jgi:predicted RNase H-like HicB family nuclease
MMKFKIIVENHTDSYGAYPLGLRGVAVGQGKTYEEALSDVKSAIRFHLENFGEDVLEVDPIPFGPAFHSQQEKMIYAGPKPLHQQPPGNPDRGTR